MTSGTGADASGARRRAVFLDRDGVLNEPLMRDGKPFPPARPTSWWWSPACAEACARLGPRDWCSWW